MGSSAHPLIEEAAIGRQDASVAGSRVVPGRPTARSAVPVGRGRRVTMGRPVVRHLDGEDGPAGEAAWLGLLAVDVVELRAALMGLQATSVAPLEGAPTGRSPAHVVAYAAGVRLTSLVAPVRAGPA